MLVKSAITVLSFVASAYGAAKTVQPIAAPSNSPTQQTSHYVGQNNGTLTNGPVVPGVAFNRIIQIWLENTNYEAASTDPYLASLASQGVVLTNYYAVTHPSEPNYMAVAGGSFFGNCDDAEHHVPSNVSTVIDLLDTKNISWATYQENMPTDGFQGFNFTNPDDKYVDYVRKHNPLVLFESIASNSTRQQRIRNFNDFAADVSAGALPQWVFITPNMRNDGHDTNIAFAANWTNYFLTPLLENTNFNDDKTLVILSFDESDVYTDSNRVYTVLLGGAVQSMKGTNDSTVYTHYSTISTVSANWGLPALGRGDVDPNKSNVLSFVASQTNYTNKQVSPSDAVAMGLNNTGNTPGPFNTNMWQPVLAPNMTAKSAGGQGVFVYPSLDQSLTSFNPINVTKAAGSGSATGSGSSSDARILKAGPAALAIVGVVAAAVGLF
ncbi:hypothetical protein HDV00_004860 [Rhizophlyctis rosea]|nr:hypothetical protein HDV00_004860 [Rhizophlyctis rosea]